MYRGATHMRKGKLGAVNSYYEYRQKKIRREQLIILFLGILFIMLVFLVTGRFEADLKSLLNMRESKLERAEQGVYLEHTDISYHLYGAPEVAKGIYIPARKMNDYKRYIKLAKETDVNSFVIDVKDDTGYLTFATDNQTLVDEGCVLEKPPIEDIEELMNKLYEANIYPIARIVAFKDNVVPKENLERAVKSVDGSIYTNSAKETWLDPYNKENWAYLLEVSREAARVGFKEIQFDYVRFHESMNESRVLLDENISKTEIIVEFIQYICENLQKDGIKVSADVFGAVVLSDIDARIVGQDFIEMSKYLDYICPMIYPSHYAEGTFGIESPNAEPYQVILKTMNIAQSKLEAIEGEKKAIIRPWLQDFTMKSLKPYTEYGAEELKAQIKGAYDAQVEEWLFWNAAGSYTEEGLK